jgi:hypothetical protein
LKRVTPTLSAFVATAWAGALGLGALVMSVASCNVEVLPEKPAVTNKCESSSECGPNGVCTDGACYSRSGIIDEVLLEIIPEASSPFAGMPLLSMQNGLRRGAPSRAITLAGPVTFPVQVLVNGEDLPPDCPYLKVGKQSVAARVQFVRVGAVGGVPVAGLSNGSRLTLTTEGSSTGHSKNASLVPGFYDIYAQPLASNNCQIPSKQWRGVEVARDGQVLAWAPPATLELPRPITLNGRVTRRGGSLAGWQVDIIDPREEKVISTSARLGATTTASPVTNFEVSFQPLELVTNRQSAAPTLQAAPEQPLIRLRPPKDLESSAPTVYFDLGGALNSSGQANLDVSELPTSDKVVKVSGQVRGGANNEGVKATVKFFNLTFQVLGLPAAYGPAVTTDVSGRYAVELFPGTYRIVIVPEGATDDGSVVPGANSPRQLALTERQHKIESEPTQTLDLIAAKTRAIEGVATAGPDGVPAQGATLEASPLRDSALGVLRGVLAAPSTPARASAPVDDATGKFTLVLDPGDYDFALKPAAASNFAWWILPAIHVLTSEMPGRVDAIYPQLSYPVPLGGTISVTMQDKTSQPLRNAIVQAYALTEGKVTQVATARTDDMGRYRLALPPAFGSLP